MQAKQTQVHFFVCLPMKKRLYHIFRMCWRSITKRKTRRKEGPGHLDMKLFDGCSMTQVDKIPWDTDGNKIYKKVSDKDFWIDEAHDGKWWKLCTSSRKGLKGERKFGKSVGSYICSNLQCSKLQAEGVTCQKGILWGFEGYGLWWNRQFTNSFPPRQSQMYNETRNIGYFRMSQGANGQQGFKENTHRMENWSNGVLPCQRGSWKASKVAEKLNDPQVFGKLHYMAKEGGRKQSSKESTVDAFQNIRNLKDTTNKKGPVWHLQDELQRYK